MGNSQVKTGLRIQKQARSIVDKVSFRFSTTSQLKSLTYDQLLHEMQLLNQVLDELTQPLDKTVSFSMEHGTQKNFMWKIFTKIVCEKIMRNSGRVVSTKVMSVKRFIRLYADIMHQISAAAAANISDDDLGTEPPDLSASLIIDGIENTSVSSIDLAEEECCICMERECQLILPCTHGYCEQCIKEWSETPRATRLQDTQSTCPLCRGPLEDASHHWVVTETGAATPERDEMPTMVLGLVDQLEGGTATDPVEPVDETLTTSCTSDGYMLVSHGPPPT